jgi:S1-C subfamily serine protease
MLSRLLPTLLCLLALALPAHAAEPGSERAALEKRLEKLQSVLAGDVCADPDGARAVLAEPVDAVGDAKPDAGKAAPTAAKDAAAPAAQAVPRDQLVDHLKKAVALVLTRQGSGSGFFITPNVLLTNAHVVEGAKSGDILVVAPDIGGRLATLLAVEKGSGLQARDYALLRIDTPSTATLPLSATETELQPVIAAGFPGLLIENDIHFQRLIRGNPTGMPSLILSQGSVMAVQNRGSRVPTIAHGAAISAGNSGGPLVDACGRVIGINTFIRVSTEQASHAGFAIAADDVIRFLKERGQSAAVESSPCR